MDEVQRASGSECRIVRILKILIVSIMKPKSVMWSKNAAHIGGGE
jgi:hypothetical protein